MFIGCKIKTLKHIKKLFKIIKRILLLLVFLLVFSIIALSLPQVQTFLAQKATTHINKTYGTNIYIDRLSLTWKAKVNIHSLLIRDHHNDTLIFSKELKTHILSLKKISNGVLDFDCVDVNKATLNVITHKGEEKDNLTIFSSKFIAKQKQKSSTPFKLTSNKIRMKSSNVLIANRNLETSNLFHFTNINLNATNFNIIGATVSANVETLSSFEDQGIVIKNMQSNFKYTPNALTFKNTVLETKDSKITGDIALNYEKTGMTDFSNNVVISASFSPSTISTNDLNSFYNKFGSKIDIALEGQLKGTLNDFKFFNGRLAFENSNIEGSYAFKNILNKETSYSISSLDHSITTTFEDLKTLMPQLIGDYLPNEIKSLGSFTTVGATEVSHDFLKTNSEISSTLGNATALFEIGNITDYKNADYKGTLKFNDFNIGELFHLREIGKVNTSINFDGSGFSSSSINTKLNGTVNSFTLAGYTYKNATISGSLKDPIFNGKLKIDDPHLKMDFLGLVDVSKENNKFDFDAVIEYAELNKLKIFKRDSLAAFSGRILMDVEGTNLNDARGTIDFLETSYKNSKDHFYFEDLLITSSFEKQERTIAIKSPDIINGMITGRFLVEDIPALFQNSIASIYTNYIPKEVTTNQYINYDFEVYNKVVDLFIPALHLGKNTKIKGAVYSDQSKFQLNFKSPELSIYDNYLNEVIIKLDNDNPLYNAYVAIDSAHTNFYDLSNINIVNKTINDTLHIQSEFKGGKQKKDLFDMSLYHTINTKGNSVVGFKKSKITYQKTDWWLNKDNTVHNKILFDNNFLDFQLDSLALHHENQAIQIAGFKTDSTQMDVRLGISNVAISKLTPVIDSLGLAGNINGAIHFTKNNGVFFPSSKLLINDISLNKASFGDLHLNLTGNHTLTQYKVSSSLVNNQKEIVRATGKVAVSEGIPKVDLEVSLNKLKLEPFSAFGGPAITDFRGLASGKARIKGNYIAPDIEGHLLLQNSGLKIPYLNIDFDLAPQASIALKKDTFTILNTSITDTKHNTQGVLSGSIQHKSFNEWFLDLAVNTDRLLVLDTPPDNEALYYGTAFISGTSNIKGPVEELIIDVEAITEEGTSFKIPIDDTASISDDSFIHFLSPEEKKARINGEAVVIDEIKGLSLNFELDINENAEVEVVVDPVNNSTLKGRGAGILLLEINTLGKFNMWGDFLVIEGKYDFRYGGIVDKKIDVVPGGNITWDGNPTRAKLDLTAKYETQANPSVLLDNPTFNQEIPVEVLVDLKGEILKPELDFRLHFPKTSSSVRSELEYLLQDKDQRQTQALFLVSTGSFQSDAAAGNALTTTLADQVNKLVADILVDNDSKFKVLPSVIPNANNLTRETRLQVGVELSTQITERILINGKVGLPVGGANESTVAGDIEVQLLVNKDGSLRINFFNRQADLQSIGRNQFLAENQIFEQGAGVSYSVDFNTFKELVKKLFNKDLTKTPVQTPEEPIKNYSIESKTIETKQEEE